MINYVIILKIKINLSINLIVLLNLKKRSSKQYLHFLVTAL